MKVVQNILCGCPPLLSEHGDPYKKSPPLAAPLTHAHRLRRSGQASRFFGGKQEDAPCDRSGTSGLLRVQGALGGPSLKWTEGEAGPARVQHRRRTLAQLSPPPCHACCDSAQYASRPALTLPPFLFTTRPPRPRCQATASQPPLPRAMSYWVVAVPNEQKSEAKARKRLEAAVGGSAEAHAFNIPTLKVGTLDKLMVLSDKVE